MNSPIKPKGKLPGVHAFRGYAALLVVFCHAADAVKRFSGFSGFDWMIEGGVVGVCFFFVLSGFIMGHVHGRDPKDLHYGKVFALKRFFRVVPMYWLVTILVFIVIKFGGEYGADSHDQFRSLVHSLFFIPLEDGPVLRVGWTLNHEVLFYALFCTAFYVFKRPVILLGGWMLAVLANGFSNSFSRPSGDGVVDVIAGFITLGLSPLNLLFALGLLATLLIGRMQNVASHIKRNNVFAFSGLLFGITLLAMVWWKSFTLGPGMSDTLRWWKPVIYGILSVAILGLLAVPAIGMHFEGATNSLLGNSSYAVYLIHYYVIAVASRVFRSFEFMNHPIVFFVALVVCGIIAGSVFHYLIEKPMSQFFARFVKSQSNIQPT